MSFQLPNKKSYLALALTPEVWGDAFPSCPWAYPRGEGVKGFIPSKLPKLYLTTDAEYVANYGRPME